MRNKISRLIKADIELEGSLATEGAVQVTHLVEINTDLVCFLR